MVVRSKGRLSADNQDGETLLRRLATADSASLCTKRRDASAVSAALPGQFGLCGESSWPTNSHREDGARSASSRTQAQVHRADSRTAARLAAAATGFHLGRAARKTRASTTAAGECSLAVWAVLGKMGLRLKKSRSMRRNETRKSTASGGERCLERSARPPPG